MLYDRAVCLGSEYGVQNQLESPDHRGASGGTIVSKSNLLRERQMSEQHKRQIALKKIF